MRSSSPHSHFHSETQVTLVLGTLLQLCLKVQSCLIIVEGTSLSCVSSFATRIDLGQATADISLLCFVDVRNENNNAVHCTGEP